jgi:hypothetical protein
LAAGTIYTATIAGTVTDTNGVALGSTATWSFTTVAAGSPVIVSQSPAAGATGVSTGTSVSVTFDRTMNSSTFTSSTFTLRAAGSSSNVAASIAVSGATATLTPSSALATGTTYTVTVTGTVTDNNGVALGSTATWTFTTADTSAPITVQVSPNSGSGTSVTFALSVTDIGGYANVTQSDLFIGPSIGAANSCYFEFDRPNGIYLRNDANTSWSVATVGTATVLQNSQCSINASQVTVSGSGNTITVNVPVTFLINQNTAWNLYGFAADSTRTTGWQNSGTWIP